MELNEVPVEIVDCGDSDETEITVGGAVGVDCAFGRDGCDMG